MKNIFLTTLVFLLVACDTTPKVEKVKPEIVFVKQIEYVVRIPPKELLTLPEKVKEIDPDTAQESDVAKWLLEKEKRVAQIEEMLRQIAIFFSLEQIQLNEDALKKSEEQFKKSDKQ